MYTASGKLEQKSLFDQYLPLVYKQASKLKVSLPASVEYDDLVQSGVTGLLEAISRFDESKGSPFASFASVRIHGAMVDELRVSDWLPRSVRRSGREMTSALRELEQTLGRPPSEAEVAKHMGIELEDYQKLLLDTNCGVMKPFEDLLEEGAEPEDPNQCADAIVNAIGAGQYRERLVEAIKQLPEREKQLLALYYQEEMTMKEIGAVFEVSEARVCQIHSQAITRLRAKISD